MSDDNVSLDTADREEALTKVIAIAKDEALLRGKDQTIIMCWGPPLCTIDARDDDEQDRCPYCEHIRVTPRGVVHRTEGRA